MRDLAQRSSCIYGIAMRRIRFSMMGKSLDYHSSLSNQASQNAHESS